MANTVSRHDLSLTQVSSVDAQKSTICDETKKPFTIKAKKQVKTIKDAVDMSRSYCDWYYRAFLELKFIVEPDELQLCYEEKTYQLLLTNNSQYPVVCRVFSTAGNYFHVKNGGQFIVKSADCHMITVKKEEGWGKERTELMLIEVMPIDENFCKLDKWEIRAPMLFNMGRKSIPFKIRFRRQPSYVAEVARVMEDIEIDRRVAGLFNKQDRISFNDFVLLDTFMRLRENKDHPKKKKK